MIKNLLNLEENKLDIKYFILLIFIAFIFSMAVRYTWIDTSNNIEAFNWNNEIMLNTNDGYYYAEGARDILSGINQQNDLSPITTPLAKLTAFLAQIIPVSFETFILWMPGIIGSLLVIPIMLISRIFKQDIIGFCAALLAGIAWSYYNRTMFGYFDTDLLMVVLPTFLIWGIMYALKYENSDSFLIAPIFALIAMNWHGGLVHIVNGVFIMTFLYTITYERKNLYYYKFLSVFIIVLTTLPILLKSSLMVLLVVIYHFFKKQLTDKIVIIIAISSSILYFIFGGIDWIISILNSDYVMRLVAAELDMSSLKFFGVVSTVREASSIPFETFANRISGHTITFWLSVIGYLLFIIRYKLLMISLPMVILGFFALQGGLRFTVFAVPFMALGVVYLIFIISKILESFIDKERTIKVFKIIFISFAMFGILYPNVKHAQKYKVPTVFQKDEVKVLDKLKKIATREDYIVSWWDYGYPIRYYSDVKTLIDGSKHSGKPNFSVSFALMKNQIAAANMARLDVEFTEQGFKNKCGTSIECMLKAYRVQNPNHFFKALNKKNFERPVKTRDIYFYLPNKMMNIFSTVDVFSNLNILTGQKIYNPFFFISKNFTNNGKVIDLQNDILIHLQEGKIQIGNQMFLVKNFVLTQYDENGKFQKNIQLIDSNAQVSVIMMKDYNQILVMDDRSYNSLYIQLFALENYDKDLFEPVIMTPLAKVYKLKI